MESKAARFLVALLRVSYPTQALPDTNTSMQASQWIATMVGEPATFEITCSKLHLRVWDTGNIRGFSLRSESAGLAARLGASAKLIRQSH